MPSGLIPQTILKCAACVLLGDEELYRQPLVNEPLEPSQGASFITRGIGVREEFVQLGASASRS